MLVKLFFNHRKLKYASFMNFKCFSST